MKVRRPAWLRGLRPQRRPVFAIGLHGGPDPWRLRPLAGGAPVLTRADVTDVHAEFVADPFLAGAGVERHMLFEAFDADRRRGVIACAHSRDGRTWRYGGVVLAEPFHLSYPHVLRHQGQHYLVPESHRAGAVHLYRATSFPDAWCREATLLEGAHRDASPFRHGGAWWMFTCSSPAHDELRLFRSETLTGPWREHPASPVRARDPRGARPAGRVLRHAGRLYRFGQDAEPSYGSRVWAFEIVELDATRYQERRVSDGPLLAGGAAAWNQGGMHHVDLSPEPDGSWLAAVDGWRAHRYLLGADADRLLRRPSSI